MVSADVGDSARGKVRVNLKTASAKVRHRRVDQLVKVVRKDLGAQTHRNTLYALRQQQRKLDRQKDRFLASAVVARLVLRDFGRKSHVEGKLAQARFDVSGSCRTVSGVNVAPVSLGIDQEVLLAELHECIANRSVAVRMVLHRLTDNVGHFVKATVLHLKEGVHQSTLYWLQAVFKGRNRTFQNDVAGIVQEVLAVHAAHSGLHRLDDLTLGHNRIRSAQFKRLIRRGKHLIRHTLGRLFQFSGGP